MEPEVHIIEKYFQEVLHCFTMTNIRCKGGKEIDLLAVNLLHGKKYHVECRISTSPSFKLRLSDSHTSKGKPHRRGLDYFIKEKFYHPSVVERIQQLFLDSDIDKTENTDYEKILVIWDIDPIDINLKVIAKNEFGIEVVGMTRLLKNMIEERITVGSRDDVLRTMELIACIEERKIRKPLSLKSMKELSLKQISRQSEEYDTIENLRRFSRKGKHENKTQNEV